MKISVQKLGLLCAVTGLMLFVSARTASAARISKNNPYRSFSITGMNYGAVQWEKAHRKGQTPSKTTQPTAPRKWRRGR